MSSLSKEWAPIEHYEGIYRVSNFGDVHNLQRNRYLKPRNERSGYLGFYLSKDGKKEHHMVHRLVLHAFGPPQPSTRHQCNHIDGDKLNNHISNLEWVTPSENRKHAFDIGINVPARGEQVSSSRLTETQVKRIRRVYAQGLQTQAALARYYQVHYMTIWNIIHRKNWKHI